MIDNMNPRQTAAGPGATRDKGPGLRPALIALMMILVGAGTALAQRTLDVTGFIRQDNDLMARVTHPVRDHDEGRLCALIRVISPLDHLTVRADGLGIVEKREVDGELWLYVPYGARSLSISHPGYVPVMFQYPYPIEEGTVYELRLAAPDGQTPASSSTQMLALTVRPEDAGVWIDDVEFPVENGVVVASMNKGEHTYRVEASMYEDKEGTVTLGDSPVRENVALFPLFGTISLTTLPEHGFEVSANGKDLGLSPIKAFRCDPGTYRIHLSKKNYHPVDTVVRLRAGEALDLNIRLTSHADSLFYNRRLGGRRVSLGVRAGYLQPMVSTDSKGGFTGSAINYGLGNSRENVRYSGQTGFTAGLIVDIRLIKNFYLQTGVDYNYIRYNSKFSASESNVVLGSTQTTVTMGHRSSVYTEQYTYHELQLPVMASYRFVLSKRSSLHVNLGPYVSYGLSAKMKLNGSTDSRGNVYNIMGGAVDYNSPQGVMMSNYHISGDIDLYSRNQKLTKVEENGSDMGYSQYPRFKLKDSPLKRFNYGLSAGVVYELSRFQLGVRYSFDLSNRANAKFWDSDRIPLFTIPGDNRMSSYRHNIHSLAITLGYILR